MANKDAAIEAVEGKNVLKLTKPVNGMDTLVFNFDRLTGYTLMNCYKAAKKDDPTMTVQSLSPAYQAQVAACACGLKYDDILSMNVTDYTAVLTKTMAFLFNTET